MKPLLPRLVLTVLLIGIPSAVRAEQLCDPSFEDCRALLINMIRNEQVGIDVGFWFMEDARYSAELVRKVQQGVPVRVLVDTRANESHPNNVQVIAQLVDGGVPVRRKAGGAILHWKMMLFAGQAQVEFSGANYSADAMVPTVPYQNYIDEVVYFSDDPAIVHSFMRKFDDAWTDPALYLDHANMSGVRNRRYPQYSIAPELNFPPLQDYRTRAVGRYAAESESIDVIMYRITDSAHTDALIAAAQRGVQVRLITEPEQYRDPARLWHSWNIDRLYMAAIPIRWRAHEGLNHEKLVLLRAQGTAIFGSSNWTSPSAASQEEHNIFSKNPAVVDWLRNHFERKWSNLAGPAETQPFTPLPPDKPVYTDPMNGAGAVPPDAPLRFNAGPFAHLYDVYLGTTPDPPLFAANVPLGPATGASPLAYQPPVPLLGHTTYYWRVVAKTMAQQVAEGPIWTFTTGTRRGSADVDGDGFPDLTLWRPSSGTWHSLTSSTSFDVQRAGVQQWGSERSGDRPFLADLDGDGLADFVVWRASTGTWYWLTSSSGYSASAAGLRQWGNQAAGDVPLLGDIDGDHRADLVVWRASTGTWFWLTSSTGYDPAHSGSRQWGSGRAGDVPMLGDIDGDARADLIVWRPGTGTWFWLQSTDRYAYGSQRQKQWGNRALGDVPLIGDIDGDARADLVVWRKSSGTWFWLTSSAAYNTRRAGLRQWGNQALGDVPVLADLDGDRKADLAVWRASTGTWYWLPASATYSYDAIGVRQWGAPGDIPVFE